MSKPSKPAGASPGSPFQPEGASPGSPELPAGQRPEQFGFTTNPLANENAALQPEGASPGSPELPAGQRPQQFGLTANPLANENAGANYAPSRTGASALRLSALLLLAGCGNGDPVPTAFVEGTVLLDDAPLADAEVNFLGSGYAGIAKTDAQGAFKLKAQVGKNIVYFSKYEGEVDPTMTMGMEGKSAKFLPKQLVPKKYTTDKSEIKDDVPSGGQQGIEFRLKSP